MLIPYKYKHNQPKKKKRKIKLLNVKIHTSTNYNFKHAPLTTSIHLHITSWLQNYILTSLRLSKTNKIHPKRKTLFIGKSQGDK